MSLVALERAEVGGMITIVHGFHSDLAAVRLSCALSPRVAFDPSTSIGATPGLSHAVGPDRSGCQVQRKDVRNVRHRVVAVVAGLVVVVALLVSLSVASAGTKRTGATTAPSAKAAIAAPKVPNAAAIKAKYGGQSITFIGDSVGGGHTRDVALANQFSKDTGINVKVRAPSDRVRRLLLAARAGVHVALVLVRRGDDRRRLAGRVRAVPRRPEAEARRRSRSCTRRGSSPTTRSTVSSSPCRGSATSGSSTTAPTC